MAKRALTAVVAASSSRAPAFWLLKSEPADYSIAMMEKEGTTVWDGVRNPVARKNLRAMAIGDQCLFYHSSCGKNVGVVGVVECVREAYPDPADANWAVVDVRHVQTWPDTVTLPLLKEHSGDDGALAGMVLFRQARLSVQPVTAAQFAFISDNLLAAAGAPSESKPAAKRAKKSEK